MRLSTALLAALAFALLVPSFAQGFPVEKMQMTYSVSGTLFSALQGARFAFGGSEELTITKVAGDVATIEQRVAGTAKWPFGSVGKKILYLNELGGITREVDTEDRWLVTNVVNLRDGFTQQIGWDGVSFVRFQAILRFEPGSWIAIDWDNNLFGLNQRTPLFIGPSRSPGERVKAWALTYDADSKPRVESVEVQLHPGGKISIPVGTFETLTSQVQRKTAVPSRLPPGYGIFFMDVTYTWTWDRETGVLIRSEVTGTSEVGREASSLTSVRELSKIEKVKGSITCVVSSQSIPEGGELQVYGNLFPEQTGTVVLRYTKPDGTTFTRTASANRTGHFLDKYSPDKAGAWAVSASWAGGLLYSNVTSPPVSFVVAKVVVDSIFAPRGGIMGLLSENRTVIGGSVGALASVVLGWIIATRKRRFQSKYLTQIEKIYQDHSANPSDCAKRFEDLKREASALLKKGKIDNSQFLIIDGKIKEYMEKLRERSHST